MLKPAGHSRQSAKLAASLKWLRNILPIAALTAAPLLASPCASARISKFNLKVAASIRKGARFLLSQGHNGTWNSNIMTWGGLKAKNPVSQNNGEEGLVMEALLSVSQSTNDTRLALNSPAMKQGIAALLKDVPNTTYAAGFQASAVSLLPLHRPELKVLHMDERYLLNSMHSDGAYTYAWLPAEGRNPRELGEWDNSNTQYAVLGMWSIDDTRKLGVPMSYWARVARHFRTTQHPDGAWWYHQSKTGVPNYGPIMRHLTSMPQAGLATMYLVDQYLDRAVRLNPVPDMNVKRGLAYVTKHFNPNADFYSLYGDERVGLYSGFKFFGTTNWFKAGAAHVMSSQAGDGSYQANFYGSNPIIGTAYGLLFLARGGVPVVFNKLQYKGPWDARPLDDDHVTEWLSKTYETPLKWQVVNTQVSYKSWLDAPILLITGHAGDHFRGFGKKTIDKLRKFINAGGMVFSNSDGGTLRWNLLMKKAAEQIVHNKYPWKTLSKKNALYHMQSLPLQYGELQGISNGVRLLWVNSPKDLGATWQRDNFYDLRAWKTAANLFFYATSKASFARKFPDLHVPPGSASRSLNVAQLHYKGNWNPEPGAWPRMVKLEAWKAQTGVTLSVSKISALSAGNTPLAVMTGTGAFTFTTAQRKALRKYMNAGGLLFADSAGGHAPFTNSFLALARKLYPSHSLHHVPPGSSIYTGTNPGGVNVMPIRYRKFFTITNGLHTKPRLLGIKVKGKWVLLFSQDDVTSGYLGTHPWGILGYATKSAQALGRNIIAYKIAHH